MADEESNTHEESDTVLNTQEESGTDSNTQEETDAESVHSDVSMEELNDDSGIKIDFA